MVTEEERILGTVIPFQKWCQNFRPVVLPGKFPLRVLLALPPAAVKVAGAREMQDSGSFKAVPISGWSLGTSSVTARLTRSFVFALIAYAHVPEPLRWGESVF